MEKKHNNILLVEDEAIIALDQINQLKKHGYGVIHTLNGEKAVEIVKTSEHRIDLILMDIDLGKGIDGTQAAKRILEFEEMPVVFLSSHTEPEVVEKTEIITSYGYVVKNSGITILDASIKMAFKLFAAHKDILKHKSDAEKANKDLNITVDNLENANKTLIRLERAIETTKDIVFITNRDELITYINPQFTKIYGYTKEETLGKLNPKILNVENITDEENDEFWDTLYKNKHMNTHFINKTKSGKLITVETSIDPIFDNNGKIKEFVQIQRDITEKLQVEQAFRESEKLAANANTMKSMLDNYEEAIWSVDRKFNFTFINYYLYKDFNEAFNKELKLGMHAFNHVRPELKKIWKSKYEAALKGERISFEFEENALREKKYFRVNLNPIHKNGKITGVSAISVDITKQNISEYKFKKERRKSQQYLDIAGVMFVAINKNSSITLVNKKLCKITGYMEDELIGQNWFEMMLPERLKAEIIPVSQKLLRGETESVEYYENPILTKKGEERFVAWHNTILTDDEGNITGHLSSGNDITEQRLIEEKIKDSERTLRTVADYTVDWEYWISPDNTYIYISPSVEQVTGYSQEDFLSIHGLYERIIHEEDRDNFLNHHHHSVTGKETHSPVDFRIITKKGNLVWISHVCRNIIDENGNNIGIRGSNRDITDRKKAEERIKELLTQKEFILKEVHHRIKNNMTTLMSLISLQASRIDNNKAVAILTETENRIRSMMVLYDKLYRSTEFEFSSIKGYLSALIDSIIVNISYSEMIEVKKKLSDFDVSAKIIFNIGIIINELITNAMKYAFKNRSSGKITISAELYENSIILVVGDDGIGMNSNIDIKTNSGFGLQLVQMLVTQMDGEIRVDRKKGTKFTIKLSLEK